MTINLGRRAVLIAAAALAIALPIRFGVVRGQSATATAGTVESENAHKVLQFDVVSIKPTAPGDDKILIRQFPDGTSFHGAPVLMVLETAFGVEDDRVIGAPSWVNSRRYDIEAKVAPEDAPKLEKLNAGDRPAMLLPLLAERFNLKYHHETRERSTYALLVAKGGPRLTKGEPDPPSGEEGASTGQNHPGDPAKQHQKMLMLPGHIEADSVPINALAYPLTQYLGRKVVGKTGLTDNYNFTLRWTPDNAPPPMLGGDAVGPVHAENATDAAPPSLFTAIQEQLGLKLESEKNSVDVIVVDHIDPPSAN